MSNPVPVSLPKESPWTQLLVGRASPMPSRVPAAKEVVEEPTSAEVKTAVREVNATLEIRSIALRFEIDQDTHRVIVKVVDRSNGEVIRQVPNEEVVRIAKVMGEMSGLLVDDAA